MSRKPLKLLYCSLFIIAALCCSYAATFNTDGTSYVNDTYTQFDELIAVGEVNAILSPGDAKHFIFYVISGSTLMYGRAVFMLDAIVSYIPYQVMGLEGQVIATRICHAFCLLWGLFILINTFIRNPWLKVATAFILIISPYTMYYTMVPKPEPLQLLSLAIFFWYFKRSGYTYGWFFLWLGIAFGSKISVLPALPFLLTLPLVYKNGVFALNMQLKPLLKGLLYFAGGFFLCLPCLLLAPFKPVFAKSYYEQTFGSTRQDDDDLGMSWLDWTDYLFTRHYQVHSIIFSILALALIGIFLYLLVKRRLSITAWLPALIGIVLLGAIFVFTKRLWPHYLYIGLALLWVGLISALEQLEMRFEKLPRVAFVILIAAFALQAQHFRAEIKHISTREEDFLYQVVKIESLQAYKYAETHIGKNIITDISLFMPYELHVRARRYEPFPSQKDTNALYLEHINNLGPVLYTSGYDAIIFGKSRPGAFMVKATDVPDRKEALNTFMRYVPSVYERDTVFGEAFVYRKKIRK